MTSIGIVDGSKELAVMPFGKVAKVSQLSADSFAVMPTGPVHASLPLTYHPVPDIA